MTDISEQSLSYFFFVAYESRLPLVLRSGLPNPKVSTTDGINPDIFVFKGTENEQEIGEEILTQTQTYAAYLRIGAECPITYFLYPIEMQHKFATVIERTWSNLNLDILPDLQQLAQDISNNLHHSVDAFFRNRKEASRARFAIHTVRRHIMLKKLLVVSNETDEMSFATFSIDEDNLSLVPNSVQSQTDIASIGNQQKYIERLTTFISNYSINHLLDLDETTGIIIVHPGEIDIEQGVVLDAGRFELKNVDLRSALRDSLGVNSVYVFHDGPSLTIGETQYGVGRTYPVDSSFFFVVGAGVGGAIYFNGKHHVGASLTAGDIGHTIVNKGGARCPVCKRKGCLETYTSRYWINMDIIQRYSEEKHKDKLRVVTKLSKLLPHITDPWSISTALLAQAVEEKDEFATIAVSEAAEWLGYGIALIVDFLNPHLIIMGGSLMESIPSYFDAARKIASTIAYPEAWEKTIIVRAENGRQSALWGGAVQAIEMLKKV